MYKHKYRDRDRGQERDKWREHTQLVGANVEFL
jgi:hypothetical protein